MHDALSSAGVAHHPGMAGSFVNTKSQQAQLRAVDLKTREGARSWTARRLLGRAVTNIRRKPLRAVSWTTLFGAALSQPGSTKSVGWLRPGGPYEGRPGAPDDTMQAMCGPASL